MNAKSLRGRRKLPAASGKYGRKTDKSDNVKNMIEIKNIDFAYGRRKSAVFENFSLTLHPGRIYGLLGKNGTGKSTLLHLVCGLLRPQHGAVLLDGIDVRERRPEVLQDLFLVPEEFDLPATTLENYVRLNEPFYPRFDGDVLQKCLADFGLKSDLHLGELSMGQKKKVFMCFALAAGTRYLLMDEPTNGLDIPAKSEFRRVVSRHMTEDRTLVISTHQVRDVDMLIDHVTVIDGTTLRLDRSVADICAALRFEERPAGADVSDALYVQPSLTGNAVICTNDSDADTVLNLELLFNALSVNPTLFAGK